MPKWPPTTDDMKDNSNIDNLLPLESPLSPSWDGSERVCEKKNHRFNLPQATPLNRLTLGLRGMACQSISGIYRDILPTVSDKNLVTVQEC